jgi:misacylated tRNA(Ala) deacylase
MSEPLFRADPYCAETVASVVGLTDQGGIVLNRTVFYPQGGGQPGDQGVLIRPDDAMIAIGATTYGSDRATIIHLPRSTTTLPAIGETVTARLDWPLRYRRMRVHTALHLLTAVLPYPVTGGAIGDGDGRLDFDIPEGGLDKNAITEALNRLIERDAAVVARWISDAELAAQPQLVKTMSVKPPTGSGQVRLIEIVGIDLQPCGGTHVARTSEIGAVRVTDIEKKGKQNRRVRIGLDSSEVRHHAETEREKQDGK